MTLNTNTERDVVNDGVSTDAQTTESDESPGKQSGLQFQNDPGASRSTWIAAGLAIALVLWMGSGLVFAPEPEPALPQGTKVGLVSVAVSDSNAESVTRFFRAEGQALPDRETEIRAEATGQIADVFVRRGEHVDAGAAIARIDDTRVQADVARAEAVLADAQRDLDNSERLFSQDVLSADERAQARLALATAQAQLTVARAALADTEIKAAFAGRIESLDVDPGEFVQAGTAVGRIVDNQPLMIAIEVPQQALTRIKNGQSATVNFITGEQREGVVSFVGTAASAETRTFSAEVEVINPQEQIPSGISAQVRIPTAQVVAHFVSPSSVSLSTEGELGVKIVVSNNDDSADDAERTNEDKVVGLVEFHPIEIVRAQIDGVWVTGLPDTASIIVIGQGYVNDGDRVYASAADPES